MRMPTKSVDVRVRLEFGQTSNWEDSLAAHIRSDGNMVAYQKARRVAMFARQFVPQPPGIAPRTPWAKNSPSGYVRTGDLRRSIVRRRVGLGHHHIEVGEPYGTYVEYGTRYMRAQPFMAPALKAVRKEFRDEVGGIIGRWKRTRP